MENLYYIIRYLSMAKLFLITL